MSEQNESNKVWDRFFPGLIAEGIVIIFGVFENKLWLIALGIAFMSLLLLVVHGKINSLPAPPDTKETKQ